MIEKDEKDEAAKQYNIELLRTLRSFLINSSPILTKELELGNFRRNNTNDFVYKDFEEYMGKLSMLIDIGLRFNDEIYYYISRGLIDPSILEAIPN